MEWIPIKKKKKKYFGSKEIFIRNFDIFYIVYTNILFIDTLLTFYTRTIATDNYYSDNHYFGSATERYYSDSF